MKTSPRSACMKFSI